MAVCRARWDDQRTGSHDGRPAAACACSLWNLLRVGGKEYEEETCSIAQDRLRTHSGHGCPVAGVSQWSLGPETLGGIGGRWMALVCGLQWLKIWPSVADCPVSLWKRWADPVGRDQTKSQYDVETLAWHMATRAVVRQHDLVEVEGQVRNMPVISMGPRVPVPTALLTHTHVFHARKRTLRYIRPSIMMVPSSWGLCGTCTRTTVLYTVSFMHQPFPDVLTADR